MSETSEDHEVVARWERKRWADFKENLSKVSETNQFQQKHIEAFYSLDEWDCFADFLNACPFTEKRIWLRIGKCIRLMGRI